MCLRGISLAISMTLLLSVPAFGGASDDSPFRASFYLGEAIDTFAGDETIKYLNPDASGKQEERAIGGFDFRYRLTPATGKRQLWVYGETVHGVRSRDIDCTKPANQNLSLCTEAGFNPNDPGKGIVFMLRNASSLEAFTGLRYNFLRLNADDDDTHTNRAPAWLFLEVQAGFLTVEGGGSDVIDMHEIAVGAICDGGDLDESFLKIGYGRTDLFLNNRNQRWKIDGSLSFPAPLISRLPGIGANIRAFAELTADTDFGSGSDSVQSYFGLDFKIK